jgi:hypothetical protein
MVNGPDLDVSLQAVIKTCCSSNPDMLYCKILFQKIDQDKLK